jgi:hypothetical protein
VGCTCKDPTCDSVKAAGWAPTGTTMIAAAKKSVPGKPIRRKRYGGKVCRGQEVFMGAYIEANERFGSGDPDHQRRLEHVISYSAALESAYREIAELKDKLAQEKLYSEDEIRGEMGFEGIVGQSSALHNVLNLVETVAQVAAGNLIP